MPVSGTIVVNDLQCKGCNLCVRVCPPAVLALDFGRLTAKGYHPVHLIDEGCTGCALCAVVCPEAAILVYRSLPLRGRAVTAAAATP